MRTGLVTHINNFLLGYAMCLWQALPLKKHPEIEVCRLSAKSIDDHVTHCLANGRILLQVSEISN